MNLRVLSLLIISVVFGSMAAQDTISGVVIDSGASLALCKVAVKISGPNVNDSTVSDSLGRYVLKIPSAAVSLRNFQLAPVSGVTLLQKNNMFFWSGAKGMVTVQVIAMSGRQIMKTSSSLESGKFVLSNMAVGTYLIRFVSVDGIKTFRYLNVGRGWSQIGSANTFLTTEGLAKSAALQYQVTFTKLSYQKATINYAGKESNDTIRLQPIPNMKYRLDNINFSPYIDGQNPNTGVNVPFYQVVERMSIIRPYTRTIRTFSTTHGLGAAAKIAHLFGLKTFIGAWVGRDTVVNKAELDSLIAMAKRGEVDTAIIGSESMLRGDVTEAKLIEYITRFRTEVPNVPVATADVYGQLTTRPNLITACDYVYGNFYPYWEGVDIKYAMANLNNSYKGLVKIAGTKPVMISEAGWPSGGAVYGQSVPSDSNAAFYFLNLVSWSKARSISVNYFEAFDESWKTSEGEVGIHWGLFDKNGVLKIGMQRVFDGDTIADNWSGTTLIGGEGTPTIDTTFVPPIGSNLRLQGTVSHVIPSNYGIVVYIKVAGGWWIKPTYASPVTVINVDGSWICNVVTGGNDASATQFDIFMIPADYTPPSSYSLLPADKIIAKLSVIRG